jgi:large subunit ribosomal protein L29
MYKAADLRERTLDDLKELEKTLSREIFDARFKNFTNRLDDTSSLQKHRRDLARIKTILVEKLRGVPAPAPSKKAPAAPASKSAPVAPPSKPAAEAAKLESSEAPKPAKKKAAAAPKKAAAAKKKSDK